MKETIEINNFLGIKSLLIELKDINLLIGAQAVGKSITIKLLYFFKTIFEDLRTIIFDEETKSKLNTKLIQKFQDYFPAYSWKDTKFQIIYKLNTFWVEINNTHKNKITINIEETYDDILKQGESFYKKLLNSQLEKDIESKINLIILRGELHCYINELISSKIDHRLSFNQLFIPAGRSFFSNIQNNIFSILSTNNEVDPFLLKFGSLYENLKRMYEAYQMRKNNDNVNTIINNIIQDIMCGEYLFEKGKDYIVLPEGKRLQINNCSSGQQEMLPLAILLTCYSTLNIPNYGTTIYIEEPEAHLFPVAQQKIVELISVVFNASKKKLQFVITTHSPYILTSLNNLIQANKIYNQYTAKNMNLDELRKIVKEEAIVNFNDVNAYALRKGKAINLMDKKIELITSDIIDEVSNDLSIQFGNLLDLEE